LKSLIFRLDSNNIPITLRCVDKEALLWDSLLSLYYFISILKKTYQQYYNELTMKHSYRIQHNTEKSQGKKATASWTMIIQEYKRPEMTPSKKNQTHHHNISIQHINTTHHYNTTFQHKSSYQYKTKFSKCNSQQSPSSSLAPLA